LGLNDIVEDGRGRITVYMQDRDAGYSAPGQATDRDTNQYGGTAEIPFGDSFQVRIKMDKQVQQEGLDTESGEVNIDYRFNENWTLSSGLRHDNREDNSVVVPQTQEEGERTDLVVKVAYDSREHWTT